MPDDLKGAVVAMCAAQGVAMAPRLVDLYARTHLYYAELRQRSPLRLDFDDEPSHIARTRPATEFGP